MSMLQPPSTGPDQHDEVKSDNPHDLHGARRPSSSSGLTKCCICTQSTYANAESRLTEKVRLYKRDIKTARDNINETVNKRR